MTRKVLSERDHDALQELLRWWRREKRSETRLPEGVQSGRTPIIHTVLTPGAPGSIGIPARGFSIDATSTGTGVLDEPGFAMCQVLQPHQMRSGETGTGFIYGRDMELREIGQYYLKVYNLNAIPVPSATYGLAGLGAGGRWYWLGQMLESEDPAVGQTGSQVPEGTRPEYVMTEVACNGDGSLTLTYRLLYAYGFLTYDPITGVPSVSIQLTY